MVYLQPEISRFLPIWDMASSSRVTFAGMTCMYARSLVNFMILSFLDLQTGLHLVTPLILLCLVLNPPWLVKTISTSLFPIDGANCKDVKWTQAH